MRWTIAFLGLALIAACAPSRAEAQEGRTIWGKDFVSTVKAMKDVARGLGVGDCVYCHLKKGGRIDYEADTPNKQIARQMKFAFVDSLALRGTAHIELAKAKRKQQITAVYTAKGKDAGIQLTVVLPPAQKGTQPKTYQAHVDLPKDGVIRCATCHAGKVDFVTGE